MRTALKNEILGGAGAAFDTLKELQNALGGDADFAATVAGKIAEAAPSGMIAYFAGQTAPAGWLKANGAAVSRTAYARLFAAVGTTYGAGDGKTTFNLPDLRGEFLRGWDDARGIDTGRAFGSVQAQSVPDHYHGIGNVSSSDDGFFVNAPWKVAKTYHGRSRDLAPFPGASFAQDKSVLQNQRHLRRKKHRQLRHARRRRQPRRLHHPRRRNRRRRKPAPATWHF